ncbi:cold shock domain-containing protein [Ilyomonas limi]|uniref:Cold shock domain-containing protein n=1 Tax=Ilyomonas limi TaxID=2575867 RepID=A0A4V5UTX1_9BACT|nr:cold shock domain-containing protein [Ilyomonas limi]TKK66663.1 cold shock domain-containing protein [Ilyomonas limi]
MGRSQQTHQKREKEKQRIRQREDKAEKMQERKANAQKGKSLDDMLAYVDENGNLSSSPPDPKKKKLFNAEDMQIGVPKHEETEAENPERTGIVTFFNGSKGFGFVKDGQTGESAFVHINQLSGPLKENDKVTYEVEMGHRGLNAINVKKIV